MRKDRLGNIAYVDISGIDKKTKDGERLVKLCNFTDVYYNWAVTKNMYDGLMEASASDGDIETFTLCKGQVAITKDSETRDDIGIAAYIADSFDDVVLGYHCALITPKTDIPEEKRVYGKYLNAILHSQFAKKYFSNNATGSGQRYTLSKDTIENMPLNLPSYEEQKLIGDFLSTIDRKMEINKITSDELESLAKQIYDYWFVQFDFPDKNGKPYKSSGGKMVWNETLKREIPEGWTDDWIYNLVKINESSITNDDALTIIDYLDTSNLNKNYIGDTILYDRKKAPSRAQRKIKDKTILYSTVRPGLCHYGILIKPPSNLIVSTGFATIDANNPNDAYRIYLFLTSDSIVDYLAKLADTSVSAYPSINPSDIGNLSIVIPDNSIIDSFCNYAKKLYEGFSQIQTQIKELQSLRDYLLPLLMTGQVTIKD